MPQSIYNNLIMQHILLGSVITRLITAVDMTEKIKWETAMIKDPVIKVVQGVKRKYIAE